MEFGVLAIQFDIHDVYAQHGYAYVILHRPKGAEVQHAGAVLIATAVYFGIAGGGCGAQAASGSDTKYLASNVREILALPEDKIDTGIAALTLAKEIYPEINVAAYSAQIDQLAMDAKRYIDWYGRYDPDSIIRALNTWYHKVYGMHYDLAPGAAENNDNYFLNRTLDTRKGMCITMPLLYAVIAQRLGYPVRVVIAPEHTFLRFDDPALKEKNIELSTSHAGYESDAGYTYRLNISNRGITSGAYLRTLTKRQHLSYLLMQNALVYSKSGDIDRAKAYLEIAQKIDPRNIMVVKNLSTVYMSQSKRAKDPEGAVRQKAKSYEYFDKAEAMGWVRDPDANIRRDKK